MYMIPKSNLQNMFQKVHIPSLATLQFVFSLFLEVTSFLFKFLVYCWGHYLLSLSLILHLMKQETRLALPVKYSMPRITLILVVSTDITLVWVTLLLTQITANSLTGFPL